MLSSLASLWVLWETWRESAPRRPSLLQTLLWYWPTGTAFLILFFHFASTFDLSSSLPPGTSIRATTAALSPIPSLTFSPMPTPTPVTIILVVTPTFTPTPTLPYGYEKVCSTAPPSPFAVGRQGYICNKDKIRLREKPSLRSRVIAVIPPPVKFEIIGGPECGYYRVWWKIRLTGNEEPYYNGLVGWMAETSPYGEEVYICPLP